MEKNDIRKITTKNGRIITMKKVKPHGKNKNLTWKIIKNDPATKSNAGRKPRAKGIAKAREIQRKRSKRAKTMDSKQTAKRVYPPSRDALERWKRNPGRMDIKGVDTSKPKEKGSEDLILKSYDDARKRSELLEDLPMLNKWEQQKKKKNENIKKEIELYKHQLKDPRYTNKDELKKMIRAREEQLKYD